MSKSRALPNGHPGEIILFTFPESTYGRRLRRYLDVRALPYSQIRVPPNMPRPLLLDKLGINHRRIPIMSIGRDIYIDTRLIISKLEALFPEGALAATNPWEAGFEAILEGWTIDGGLFWRSAGCIPLTAPLLQDEVWMKDRKEITGGAFTKEALAANRSWCISQLKLYFSMLEPMFGDGRKWVLGKEHPTLAEFSAGWMCDWAINMASDMQDQNSSDDVQSTLSKEEFPGVHDWTQRFRKMADEAKAYHLGAGELQEGQQAEDQVVKKILSSAFTEQTDLGIDSSDVLVKSDGMKAGQRVSVAPADSGSTYKDVGSLVGLSANEAVIEIEVPAGQGKLRLHYPRVNFKILPA